MLQRGDVPVGVGKAQVAEFDLAPGVRQLLNAGAVKNIFGRVQQLTDPLQGCLAPGGHVDQIGHSHNGPDHGVEIADELHKLTGVELTLVDQIAAVAQNHADDALHEGGHQNPHQYGGFCKSDVGILAVPVQLFKGHQLLDLLHKGLDDGNSGKALLSEVGQIGEALLPVVPLPGHVLAHHRGAGEQQPHGDQGQDGEQVIHAPHSGNGQRTQNDGVKELHEAPAVALLNSVQIVGEQAHQIAHLVHLIILPAQVFCVAEHLIPQVRLHLSSRAEDRYPPQETAEDDGKDDADHGHADPVQQEHHIKGHLYAVFHNVSLIQSIDDQLINFRHLQLQVVHGKQRQQPRQQSQRVLAVIDVDMLAENQENPFSSLLGSI